MDEQREIITAFTEMAPRYEQLMNSELNRFWGIDYHSFVKRLLSKIDSNESAIILDVATGTSYIPLYILTNDISFGKIVGLDITLGMLEQGKLALEKNHANGRVIQVCASALQMPFGRNTYDIIICCLATHHMDVGLLLENVYQSLKPKGSIYLADAGGSSAWKNGAIKLFIKLAAFIYFLFQENLSRAKAESCAIVNIHSPSEWEQLLQKCGFKSIELTRMKSSKFWVPDPLIIRAKK